jgi:diaminohydroxyphosphoribosylaminopyrimidine deaminase/5-amino-6-(5-phosphoribosylamino)uracil reductase
VNADARWMDYAVRLGQRALGTTAENPPVGCVIIKNDLVVGVGWTGPGGRPHAETDALAMAGAAARGATAYVTLEPCAHHGRTPPCAEALVAAGIARVVVALGDPDPRVSGGGLAILRAAGITVEIGMGAEAARPSLSGFLTRIVKKRPYVILKLGVSSDGKIAAGAGQRTQITGTESRARVHLLRATCNAIMVGVATVRADDPELTCRLPGLEGRSPIRVVADSHLTIPRRSKLVQTAPATPVWIAATRAGEVAPGVTVLTCAKMAGGWVDMADAARQLASRGINRLLVEGGAHIVASCLAAGIVDEVQIFQSPVVLGSAAVDAIAGMPLAGLGQHFRITAKETLGSDVLTVYEHGL